jgi:hypothetical protein
MRLDPAADQGTDGPDEIDYPFPSGIGYRILDRLVLKRQLEEALERGAARFESMLEAELRRSRTLS